MRSRLSGAVSVGVRLQRFELLASAVGVALLVAAAFYVRAHLESFGASQACIESWVASAGDINTCGRQLRLWSEVNLTEAGWVTVAMNVLPVAAGIVLGTPIVAREIEARTAAIAWSLANSRRYWLAVRLLPAVALVAVGGVLLAWVSADLERVRTAEGVWGSSYTNAAGFGLPLAGRFLAGFSVALLVGGVLGRTLPALITAAAVVLALGFGLSMASSQFGFSNQLLPNDVFVGGPGYLRLIVNDSNLEIRLATQTGELLAIDEALATVPDGVNEPYDWLQERYEVVSLGISSMATAKWQAVDGAISAIVAATCVASAFAVVNRRRPV